MTDEEIVLLLDNLRQGMANVWATAYAAGYTTGYHDAEYDFAFPPGTPDARKET